MIFKLLTYKTLNILAILVLITLPYKTVLAQPQQHDKTLNVGFGMERPPFVFKDHKRGLEIELLDALAKQMGYKVNRSFMPNARGIIALNKKEIDLFTTVTKDFDSAFHLSKTYMSFNNVAISKKHIQHDATNLSELAGYRVAAFQGADIFIKPIEQLKDKLILYIETPIQKHQIRLLHKDRVDFVISEKKIFEHFYKKSIEEGELPPEGFVYKIHKVLPPTLYSAAFTQPDLRDSFDKAFDEIIKNGTYIKIMKNYDSNFSIKDLYHYHADEGLEHHH